MFLHKLWLWLIQPSPSITEPDRRRQAALLSAFLVGIILLAIAVESLTVLLIDKPGYRGYWSTLAVVFLLLIIYGISRSTHIQLAVILTVVVASLAVFAAGWVDPSGVQGGLFDYMILPIWLASLYLSLKKVLLLILANLAGLLLFPLVAPEVSINFILIGPFSFLSIICIGLIVITHSRNLLEQDRQKELAEKEERSRREAARASVLLSVAERLNAQLDQTTLLQAICEEVARALDTPVSIVALYDPRLNAFVASVAAGIPPELVSRIEPVPRERYETIRSHGTIAEVLDPAQWLLLPNQQLLEGLDLHSLAFATMEYGTEPVGYLTAITPDRNRRFSQDELLLLQGLADQAALAIVNTGLFKDAHRRLEQLQALRAIDLAILSNHDLRQTLDVLLEKITSQLHVDAAVILLMDGVRQSLEFGASRGFQTSSLRFTRLRLGEGMAGQAALRRQTLHIRDLHVDPHSLVNASMLAEEGFVSYFAAPLIAQEGVNGVLEVFHRSILDPDPEWLAFLETLTGQAAIAIESTTLIENLQSMNSELSNAYDSTIEGWSHALDLRDKETEGHTRRVTDLTLELARVFGYEQYSLMHIRRGSLLHDIGKMGIPDRILLKEDKLTEEEWAIMRKHPVFAQEMLQSITYLRPALEIPYCHHERWDGTGYPSRLKEEQIPLAARIFAVVDVWDALTSDRPYRPAWSAGKTLEHIRKGSGSHFDPQVVTAFVDLIERRGTGG
jgi:HD-GYP domain-containing protein (c-di-GMP phosphodiesterase class II)